MEISPVGCVRGLKCSVGLCQLHSAAERSFRSSPSSQRKKIKNRAQIFGQRSFKALCTKTCHRRSHRILFV